MLSRDVKDRRIGFVTVTGVDLSPDLRHAKVFVSILGSLEERKRSLQALNHASGFIRHGLGQRIRMKHLPDLQFNQDQSLDYGERIDHLLEELEEKP